MDIIYQNNLRILNAIALSPNRDKIISIIVNDIIKYIDETKTPQN